MSGREKKFNFEHAGRERCFVKISMFIMTGLMTAGAAALYAGPPRIEDYATIEAYSEDVPVYAFGFTYVYSVSPDLLPGTVLQTGNANPRTKIQPKKSWEIKENKMGSTPAGVPRSGINDHQPFRSIHLIDGDAETCWCSHGQQRPDVEEVWIRIDLPREESIESVTLIPHAKGQWDDEKDNTFFGQAFPKQLTIQLSRDAWHWETVYENRDFRPPREMVPQKFSFDARPAKQIWIIGRECPQVMKIGHCFSIAEAEVRNTKGDNKALISQGAAVTVSSTHHGYGMDRYTQEMLWPIQYDLGFKWTRVGYGKDMFVWSYVERREGVLDLDDRADAIVTEAVRNGVHVFMSLNRGNNWLFVKEAKVFDKGRNAWVYPDFWKFPEPDRSEEFLARYLRYVRFMVNHFKDRVQYFEIWNEWDGGYETYCEIAGPAIKEIRAIYPEARIVIGAPNLDETCEFVMGVLDTLGPVFDVIGMHPWYNPDPTRKDFMEYPEFLRNLKKECRARGFQGDFMATEWTYSAPYPTTPDGVMENNRFQITEMQKAKYAARLTITHIASDVYSFWNETFQKEYIEWSIGLLRNGFSSGPICPTQPEPIYYIMRTLSTVMDEATAAEVAVQFSPGDEKLEWYTMRKPDGEVMLAVWLKGYAKDDDSQEILTDITFPGGKLSQVRAIDILNGDTQSLTFTRDGENTVLKDIHIKDWPLIISGFQERQ